MGRRIFSEISQVDLAWIWRTSGMSIVDDARQAVKAGEYAQGLQLIEAAVRADVLDPQLLLLRAQCHEHLGNRSQAAVDYAHVAELLGGHPDALLPVAIQLAHLGRHEEELALYDKILARDPDHFDALYLKGLRLVKMNRHAESIAAIDRAIALRPNDGNSHYTKACAHALLGQSAEAVSSIEKAIAVAPYLRSSIADDEDFASIANTPEFRRAVG
jgi:superkiller protein 3